MQIDGWKSMAALSTALGLAVMVGSAKAQDQPDHGGAAHGGVTASAQGHRFEVVFEPGGLRVYPLDLQSSRLNGRAYFRMPGARAYSDPYPLQPLAPAPGQPADSLGVAVDLSRVPASGTKVAIQVWSLPEAPKSHAQFTVPFALSETATITVTRATQADQAAIDAQKICPISRKPLGSMGVPVKVSRGDQAVFLCCPGCVKKVQADPEAYLGEKLTVTKATQADQATIAAQKTCPVSGEELGSMGTPLKVSRGDQVVFLCCPGCVKKVQADPNRYLATSARANPATTDSEPGRGR